MESIGQTNLILRDSEAPDTLSKHCYLYFISHRHLTGYYLIIILFLGRTMKISEFGDLCGLLLGKWAEYIATLFSVLAILGAAIVYWVLMSNFLFSTVSFVHGKHI